MFSGIGGFRSGLEAAGGFECIGFCEIDKNAAKAYRAIYNTEKEAYFSDAREIDTAELGEFDLLVAGFPCQPYPEKIVIPKNDIKPHKTEGFNYKLRNNK